MRSLKPALFAAAASKTAGLAIQLLALPVAIRSLGTEAFGYYVTLLAVTSWSAMFEGGLGIHLIKELGHAQRTNDYAKAALILRAGLKTLSSVGLVVAGISVGVVTFFLRDKTPLTAEHIWLSVIVIIGSWLSLVTGFTLKVRVAFDHVHYNNLSGFAGNVLALVMLSVCFLIGRSQSMVLFYLCCVGSVLLANIISAGFVYFEYRQLWGRSRTVNASHRPQLQEMAYGFGAQLGILSERELPKIIFSLAGLLTLAGRYGVYVSLIMSLAGILTTLTGALSPRIVHLIVNERRQELRNLWRTGCQYILVICVVGVGIAYFCGYHLVNWWLGKEFSATALEAALFTAWLCSIMWNHWNYTFIALGPGLSSVMRGHLFIGLLSAMCLGAYTFSGRVVDLGAAFIILCIAGWLGGAYFVWRFNAALKSSEGLGPFPK